MAMISEDFNKKLQQWVNDGGILIAGPMTGYRSEYWTSFTDHALGAFSEWAGIYVDSRIPIDAYNVDYDDVLEIYLTDENNLPMQTCGLWSEALFSPTGKVLARYNNGMHNEHAAIIENKVGQGKVVFLGTDPGEKIIQRLMLKYAKDQGIKPMAEGEENVLVVPREGNGSKYLMILNIENNKKNIIFGNSVVDLISGEKVEAGNIMLKPYQIIIGEIRQ